MISRDAELREGNHLLVTPCLSIYFLFEIDALPHAGAHILEAYQWARDALGGALTHVDVDGKGEYRALTKRYESMVPTWLSRPREKVYWAEFWGVEEYGVSAASLRLALFWMPPRTVEDLRVERRSRRDWKTPMGRVSWLQMTLPLDHPLAAPGALVSSIQALSLVRQDILGGVAGLSLNWREGLTSTVGVAIGNHVQSLCTRFPGLELEPSSGLANTLVQWDHQRDDYVYRIPRSGWTTLLGPRIVNQLGGLSSLRSAVADPAVRIIDTSPSIVLVAGETPDVGDSATGRLPSPYVSVGRALRGVRAPTWRHRWDRKSGWVDEWLSALDGARATA